MTKNQYLLNIMPGMTVLLISSSIGCKMINGKNNLPFRTKYLPEPKLGFGQGEIWAGIRGVVLPLYPDSALYSQCRTGSFFCFRTFLNVFLKLFVNRHRLGQGGGAENFVQFRFFQKTFLQHQNFYWFVSGQRFFHQQSSRQITDVGGQSRGGDERI